MTSVVGNAYPSSTVPCAALAVRLTTPQVSNNHLYAIAYCNQGSQMANNSSIDIELDPQFGIDHATVALEARAGNVYRFHIGNIAPGACGSLFFKIDNPTMDEPCLRVYAFHDNSCAGQNGITGYISQGNINMGGNISTGGGNTNTPHKDADQVVSLAGGTRFIDPIFEDHVFLDVVPTWDSLLHIIGQMSNYNAGDPNNSEVSTDLRLVNYNRLPNYAMDKDCANDVVISTHSSHVVSVQQTEGTTSSWHWKGQPLQQQSTLIVEGKNYHQLQLTLIDASGRQIAILTSNDNQFLVDRYQQKLNSGVYYYLLEGDQEKIGSGIFAVQ